MANEDKSRDESSIEVSSEDLDAGLAAAFGATVEYKSRESSGTVIGPYKLLQQIGEGGFGVVYMAEQERPIRRRVALKLVKPGMDTAAVVARFEAERQALALMDHSNIARVLDAGATDSGRAYFVMELVKGVPITEYCDRNCLDTGQRLGLFALVCSAVQHAHQKGIIHRDLKPGNVMVTLNDGVPVPKVIDFGIAKATQARLTEKTLFTQYGQFIGTPAYMSPEQAEMSQFDVDTRTDIYSLGVLLYELLTGSTPLDQTKLRSLGYVEMQRMICTEEPPRPSNRLSESGDALPSICAQRHSEPKKLGRLLRGDLDWIVMKALEKDRTRRYETANDFAADIRRHLSYEPVMAGPPSASYRLRKFTRKHRRLLLTGSTFALLLLIALFAVGWSVLAEKQRTELAARNNELIVLSGDLEVYKDVLEKARDMSEEAAINAERHAEQQRTEMLGQSRSIGRLLLDEWDVSLREDTLKDETARKTFLDQLTNRLEVEMAADLLIEARIWEIIAREYLLIEGHDAAISRMQMAVDLLHDADLRFEAGIAEALQEMIRRDRQLAETEIVCRQDLESLRTQSGETDSHTLDAINSLARVLSDRGKLAMRYEELERSAGFFRQSLDFYREANNEREIGGKLHDLASLAEREQRYDEAVSLWEESLLYFQRAGDTANVEMVTRWLDAIRERIRRAQQQSAESGQD